jgi:hypothetical protein
MCLPFIITAQQDVEWGEVSQEELALKEVEFDKEAEAVVLYEKGAGHFEFVGNGAHYVQENHYRLKILKQSGLSHADIRMAFSDETHISKIKAHTILPNGEMVKLRNQDIFEEDYDDDTKLITFSFPQAQVGAIIEFQYQARRQYIFSIPTWYYREELPVIYSEFQIDIPPYYGYVQIHNQGYNINSLPKETFRDARIGMDADRYIFYVENLPGVRAENYITTISDYYTYSKLQLAQVSYPDQDTKKVLSDWNKLAERLRKDSEFGIQYISKRKTNKIAKEILPLLEEYSSDQAKVRELYQLLNDELRWNEEYSAFTSDDLENVYEAKLGNSADLNLIFLALLEKLDIEAHPVLISTRSHGSPLPLYPIVTQFNHVLAVVKTGENFEFYDLSEKFRPYNCVRFNALNQKGWLITDEGQKWIHIPALKGSDLIMVNAELHPDEHKITGQLKGRYANYNAIPERKHHSINKEGKHWIDRLSPAYSDVKVTEVSHKNLNKLEEDFEESVQLEMQGGMTIIDSFIYFKPITYSNFEENFFKQETRHCPVDFGHPIKEMIIFNYKIPEGYEVEDLPQNAILSLHGENGTYKFLASYNQNNIIQVMSQLDLNAVIYLPEYYQSLKDFFGKVSEKLEEQVVLKKK